MNRIFRTLALPVALLGAAVAAAATTQAKTVTPYSSPADKADMASWTPTAEASYTKSALQRAGYSSISNLTRNADGSWQARATKDNAKVNVTVGRDGTVRSN